ncbi:MAG: glycosyltransferase [Luteitalea sp.]|nr:glycosyltransferase [Luteitalea sp.]
MGADSSDNLHGESRLESPRSAVTTVQEPYVAASAGVTLSVVVCTRNRAEQLQRCLDTFSNLQSPVPWELIVVDNGSTDDTVGLLERFKRDASFPVHVVLEGRPGLGRARNAGWRRTSGAIVAFTDDDCYPAPDYLSKLVECFGEQDVAFLGGRILLYDAADYPITIRPVRSRLDIKPYSFVPTGVIQGANCAFRREALATVDGFDDEMGAGTPFACEDVEILARLTFAGFAGMYDPRPLVYHHHGRREEAAVELRKGYDFGRGAYFAKCLLDRQMRLSYLKRWYWQTKQRQFRRTAREVVGAMSYLSWRVRFRHR